FSDFVIAGVDDRAYSDIQKALAAGDTYDMLEMFSTARAFRIDNGTRVLVIDAGGGMFDPRVKLRALEGKTEGLAGWVRSAYVVSDNAVAAAVSDQVSA